MPKQKSHKGLAKRAKLTAKGKIKAKRSFGSHLMSGKNAKRRRRIGAAQIFGGKTATKMRTLLGG